MSAEKQVGAVFGNDVFFVMGSADTADEVYKNAAAAAQERGFNVSEMMEKNNPM